MATNVTNNAMRLLIIKYEPGLAYLAGSNAIMKEMTVPIINPIIPLIRTHMSNDLKSGTVFRTI
jgi:hypothetical protein